MSSPVLEEPWGQLVALEGGSERIPIIGEKFTIGRRKGFKNVVYSIFMINFDQMLMLL